MVIVKRPTLQDVNDAVNNVLLIIEKCKVMVTMNECLRRQNVLLSAS
jgi:hypothetical protein